MGDRQCFERLFTEYFRVLYRAEGPKSHCLSLSVSSGRRAYVFWGIFEAEFELAILLDLARGCKVLTDLANISHAYAGVSWIHRRLPNLM
jgi:hypothetical protein